MCAYMRALFDPPGLFMSIYYVVSPRYASVVVFGLPCPFLRLSFVSSLTCPSSQTRVTLLRQMAFCLAELHLWSTKSSLQVKGSTYRHVQSPSLSLSLSLWFSTFPSRSVLLRLSVIAHFVFTPSLHLGISALTIWLSVNTNSRLVCFHFLFAQVKFSCFRCCLLHYTWHFLCFYHI